MSGAWASRLSEGFALRDGFCSHWQKIEAVGLVGLVLLLSFTLVCNSNTPFLFGVGASLGQTDPAQQVGKAGVAAEAVQFGVKV
jgi:hypothetical protein